MLKAKGSRLILKNISTLQHSNITTKQPYKTNHVLNLQTADLNNLLMS